MGTEALTGIVGESPSVDAGHIVLFQKFQSVPAPVVRGVVHHYDRLRAPGPIFAVQDLDQVTEENLHH